MNIRFVSFLLLMFYFTPAFAQEQQEVAPDTTTEVTAEPAEVVVEEMLGLQVGEQAPDFEATTYEGKPFRFSEVYSQKPTVLIFYRGGWCPYCNTHLQEIQSKIGDFNRLGVSVVALSVDKPENEAATVAEKSLSFMIVSNPGAEVLQAYRLVEKVPDEVVAMLKNEYGIDLEAASGQTHHTIAVPAVYILNKNGKVLYAHADRDYKLRKSAEEIVSVLEELLFL